MNYSPISDHSAAILNDFLGQLQKQGLEKMLEGELDGHLGYDRYVQSPNTNSRNGYRKKRGLKLAMVNQKYEFLATVRPVLIP